MAWQFETAQRLAACLLNLAVALVAGASLSRLWLGRAASGWPAARRQSARRVALAGAAVALAANLAVLWCEAAAMAEVPVTQAASAAWSILATTHYGRAWSIGMAALAAAAVGAGLRGARSPAPARLSLASLTVFWYTRSMASHAAVEGDFSLRLLANWIHLGAISLWVGGVILAGAVVLRGPRDLAAGERCARAAYVRSLSSSATFALAGILVTGLYAAWRSLGGWDKLTGNPYGDTLLAKVLLAGVAVALGGVNRYVVMPPWLAHESAGRAAPGDLPARFRRILWIEAAVLLAALVLAAWLAAAAAPGEQS